MTSTILDDATERAQTAANDRRAFERQVVEAMRDEIGRHHYEQAKAFEPVLTAQVRTEYLPFLAKIQALSAQAHTPLPSLKLQDLTQLARLCEAIPKQLRDGITTYEGLSFKWVQYRESQAVDINVRASLVLETRKQLLSYDNSLNSLAQLKQVLEQYIHESGWPGQPTTEQA